MERRSGRIKLPCRPQTLLFEGKRTFCDFTLVSVTFPRGFLNNEVLAVKKYSSESSSKLL